MVCNVHKVQCCSMYHKDEHEQFEINVLSCLEKLFMYSSCYENLCMYSNCLEVVMYTVICPFQKHSVLYCWLFC